MTKDQFWHCLTGLPDVVDAFFSISSACGTGYDDLKLFGQQLFKFLCSSNGNLNFIVPRTAGPTAWGRCQQVLCVQHHVSCVSCDINGVAGVCGRSHWQVDGVRCKVSCPHLHFDRMPKGVAVVDAYMVSNVGLIKQLRKGCFDSYPTANPAIREFAYDDNVDVTETWVQRWLEGVRDDRLAGLSEDYSMK